MIRAVEPRDKESVVQLALEFGQERLIREGMTIDRPAAEAQFDEFIKMPFVKCLVAEDQGAVVGMIVCFVSPMVFTAQMIGQEVVWYVRKEHRGQGVRLLKKMENLLKECGCEGIMMVGLHGDEACEFYRRCEYTEFQHSFFKRLV